MPPRSGFQSGRPRFKWRFAVAAALLVALGVVAVFLGTRPAPVPPAPPAPAAPPEPAVARAVIGTSVEGRAIESFTYGDGATRLLFVGGVHGGYEWNSVVLAYEVMDYLEANPTALPANVSVTVVPNANPDGTFKVTRKEGRITSFDILDGADQSFARFNGNGVDLNRNFDCKWQPESTWRSKTVSAGTAAFSEPEAAAIRDLVASIKPAAAVFWHSQSNAVYASECENGILPETREIMSAYAAASGYPAVDTFDAYAVTGDADGWLASIGIPAVTVELSSHEAIEFDPNLAGVKALFARYGQGS